MVSAVLWYMGCVKLYDLIKTMRIVIDSYEKYLSNISGNSNPSRKLRITKERGFFRYYVKEEEPNKSYRYLSISEIDTIKELAQLDYVDQVRIVSLKTLSVLKASLSRLEGCKDPDSVFDGLSEERKALVCKFTPTTVDVAEWKRGKSSRRNSFKLAEKVIVARNGLRVRSKSEEIIVNIFEEFEIPYVYEAVMVIEGELIYPDFIVLNVRTGKEYIYEHCGMIDDPTYVERNLLRKLELYAKDGIFLGDRLLMTFETNSHPLNELYLREFIRKHFL